VAVKLCIFPLALKLVRSNSNRNPSGCVLLRRSTRMPRTSLPFSARTALWLSTSRDSRTPWNLAPVNFGPGINTIYELYPEHRTLRQSIERIIPGWGQPGLQIKCQYCSRG
jgi:hypothetical protein